LTSHLSALTIRESNDSTVEVCGLPIAEDLTGIDSAQLSGEDPHAESLEGSLSAVRKSTQAAARIFQAFRVESFHRKKVVEYGDDDCGLSDERTLSLVSLKNVKPGQHDTHLHSAAVRIQNKFRGWKGRKEFMIIRQRIVKLQVKLTSNYRFFCFFILYSFLLHFADYLGFANHATLLAYNANTPQQSCMI